MTQPHIAPASPKRRNPFEPEQDSEHGYGGHADDDGQAPLKNVDLRALEGDAILAVWGWLQDGVVPINLQIPNVLGQEWARALWADKTGGAPGFPALDEIERTGEEAMPTIAEENWDRWEAGVRAEGVLQGRASLISRQAALRFGVRTAERLSVLLNNLAEREELEQVGDWIIECGSGDELLARVSALLPGAGMGEAP